MKSRILKLKKQFTVHIALLAFVLTLFFSFFSPAAYALNDFSQHKTNVLKGMPPIESCLTISKTVKNADGSPLTEMQKTKLFAFTVTFSDNGVYPYFIQSSPQPSSDSLVSSAAELITSSSNPSSNDYATSQPSSSNQDDITSGGYENSLEEKSSMLTSESSSNGNDLLISSGSGNTDGSLPSSELDSINSGSGNTDGTLPSSELDSINSSSGNTDGSLPSSKVDSINSGSGNTTESLPSSELDSINSSSGNANESLPSSEIGSIDKPDSSEDTVSNQLSAAQSKSDITALDADYISKGTLSSGETIYLSHDQIAVFPFLPKGISYTVKEEELDDYVTTGTGHSDTLSEFGGTAAFINTFEAETITINGKKTWDLTNAPKGFVLPENITVFLMDGDIKVSSAVVVPDENGIWTYSFTVPKYRPDSTEILYTVLEAPMPEFLASVNGFNILNRYESPSITVSGTKTWNHGNNNPANYPKSITVQILADNVIVQTITVSASDNWRWSLTLPQLDANNSEIIYTIKEVPITDYQTKINGYNLTNTYIETSSSSTPSSSTSGPPETSSSSTPSSSPPETSSSSTPSSSISSSPVSTPDPVSSKDPPTKTGDNRNIMIWIIILCASAFVCICLIIIIKKPSQKNTKSKK